MDNIVVDPKTGNMWIALLTQPLKVKPYLQDHSVAVPSKCLHLRLDQGAELPFDGHALEEVFSTSGEGEMISAVTTCMHVEGKLLLGALSKDMALCEAPYLMY